MLGLKINTWKKLKLLKETFFSGVLGFRGSPLWYVIFSRRRLRYAARQSEPLTVSYVKSCEPMRLRGAGGIDYRNVVLILSYITDPGNNITAPGTGINITDPGTNINTDPGTNINTDPGTN